MNYRKLNPAELRPFLASNPKQGVEQWLGEREFKDFRFIKWVRILQEVRHDVGKWCLYEKESLDQGDENFINIDEFQDVGDPDEPEGKRHVFPTLDDALAFAEDLGAVAGGYVPVGQLPYVYKEFIVSRGKPAKGIKEWFSSP